MISKEIELAAYNGMAMPDGLDAYQQLVFHGLSMIYSNYRSGIVSADFAKRYKMAFVEEVERMRGDIKTHCY